MVFGQKKYHNILRNFTNADGEEIDFNQTTAANGIWAKKI